MNVIEATFKNGQIVPDGPPDWPEGCRLRIEPVPADNDEPETYHLPPDPVDTTRDLPGIWGSASAAAAALVGGLAAAVLWGRR